jgi:NTE family protein
VNEVQEVPRARRGVREATVLAIASLGAFLAFVDATIVNVAFPDIRRTFEGTAISQLSWVFNAYNVVFAAFLVAAGRLADLLGHRRLFIWGIGIFTAASALCGLAPSVGTLIAARALQALGAAILVPASLALVLSAFDASRRTHAVGLWGAAAALAAGLGPPLGGAIVELESWRSAFLINVPVGIGAIWLARRSLVESRAPGRRTMPDLRGSALLAGGVAALTLAIVEGETWGWTSPGVIAAAAVGVVLLAVVVRRVGTHPSPVVDPGLLRVRAFGVANVLTLLAGLGFYAYLLNHILFLTSLWDYTVLEAGLAVAPGALVAAITAGTFGRIADRYDPRLVIVPGAAIWAGAYLWYVEVVGPQPAFLVEWLPGQVLSGIGVGMTLPVLGAAAVAAVPGGRFAMASSVVSSTRQLGGVLGIALLVVIVGTPETPLAAAAAFDDGWTLSAACFAVVALGAVGLGRIARDHAEDEPQERRGVVAPPAPAGHAAPPVAPYERVGEDPVALLTHAPLLAGLDAGWVARLAEATSEWRLQAGEYLLRTGEPADAVYVVRSGRLEVFKGDEEQVIQVLGTGDAVGELGVLSGERRAADVRAARDSILLRIAREDLDEALADSPATARSMLAQLAGRIQSLPASGDIQRAAVRVIAVVPVTRDVDPRPLVEGLARELGGFGPLEVLWDADGHTLERAERRAERVLLGVSATSNATWREFALRQADRVVAVAGPQGVPNIELLHPHLRGCELVFAGHRPPRPGLTTWFDLLEPRHGSLVRSGPEGAGDLARLARRIAGRAVGLVLSGGGARALAHLGVIEELEAQGIVVDRVAGVSMGSIIAGLVARGLPAASIDALVYEEFVRRQPMSDYHLSGRSLLRGQRAAAMVTRLFGEEGLIEELEREFFCVSVDLVSRELVEFRRGRVREAVGASSVIPGVLPAVARQGQVHVDGGVLNNLPVDRMALRADGPIIAVDVTEQFDPTLEGIGDTKTDAAGFAAIGLRDAIVRSITLGSLDTADAAARHAALVIRPDSGGAGIFEFHQIDALRESGRQAAREALRTWSTDAAATSPSHPPVETNGHGRLPEPDPPAPAPA